MNKMTETEKCTSSKPADGTSQIEYGSGEPFPHTCNNPNPCPGYQNCIPANTKQRKLGVHCQPLGQPVTIACLDKPSIIPDMKKPIFCNWPQEQTHPTPPRIERPDPLSEIPDQTVSQVVEVLNPGIYEFMKPTMNHPLCPDAQFTLTIDPPQKKEVKIRIPECECPVRPPQRPWRQCIESQLINDQVRRPLARWCHKRELPPLVLPFHEMGRLQMTVTKNQREQAELAEMLQQNEYDKLKSRYRHSVWNYTVESLLERKRNKEAQKMKDEEDSTKQLLAEVKAENERNSQEWDSRAKKLMLYRKGLIRDFHAAMSNSKMLKDIEDGKNLSKGCEGEEEKARIPFFNKTCMRKMMAVNNRPEYKSREKTKRPNPKLLEAIQRDEKRVIERKCEMDKELAEVQTLMFTSPDLPTSYKRYITESVCNDNEKQNRQLKMRQEICSEIHNKLAVDAFVGAHETEIDRQACEFNQYKRTVDYMRKQKEKQLIDEKVQHNIRLSEKAGEVLSQMKQKQPRTGEYDSLKEQWEADFAKKAGVKKEAIEKRLNSVYKNFWVLRK